jgi:hypothetical protein
VENDDELAVAYRAQGKHDTAEQQAHMQVPTCVCEPTDLAVVPSAGAVQAAWRRQLLMGCSHVLGTTVCLLCSVFAMLTRLASPAALRPCHPPPCRR